MTERKSLETERATKLADLSDGELLNYCGDDARKWAEAFCQIKQKQGWSASDIDESLMLGWFANAIVHSSDVRCRLAAQDQKPKAWLQICGDVEIVSKTSLDPGGFERGWTEKPLYLDAPPAAGWNEAIEAALAAVETLRINAAADFKDPRYQGQRGVDCCDALYDAHETLRVLRHDGPPDSGAGKSDLAGVVTVVDDLNPGIAEARSLPDHGGADAGVEENEPPDYLWWGKVDGKDVVTFGRWPKRGARWRYKLAEIQPTEHDHQPAPVDPSEDERWQDGLDFAMTQLCTVMGVDPHNVTWDAATEEIEGDVRGVIWNILRAKMGEDWKPAPVAAHASAELQSDLGEMLRALGMSDAAQPKSPHEVFQSALEEMKRQLANASAEARLREALKNVKAAILESDPDIVTDTLWLPKRISPNETVVDHIDLALSAHPTPRGSGDGNPDLRKMRRRRPHLQVSIWRQRSGRLAGW